jgi:hypothetical protein
LSIEGYLLVILTALAGDFDPPVTDGALDGGVAAEVRAAEPGHCLAPNVAGCVFAISAAVHWKRVSVLKRPASRQPLNYRLKKKLISNPFLTLRHGFEPKLTLRLSKKPEGRRKLKRLWRRQTLEPSKSVKQRLTVKPWNLYLSRKQLENVSLIFSMITM